MSKAEDRAIEKYPIEMYEEVGWRCVDKNAVKREYFVEGYHQAEKDLELIREEVIEKASKWLDENAKHFLIVYHNH